ncbi:MAG: FtsX-like permease family protein, partial [Clostridia bacterium]|nr:FtsX-like permease family protein [Clostridia bacterium]
VIMIIVFSGLVNERKKEFAVLRVVGMSRKMLSRLILTESLILSVIGGVIGIALGAAVVFPFSAAIEARIGLPFLTPGAGTVILLAVLSLVAALVAGPAASAYSAYKLSRVDTGVILREGM